MSSMSIQIPSDVLKLLNLVLSNAATKDDPKYHKVNLAGKAGQKLQSSAQAMSVLMEAGWATVGTELVIGERGESLRAVSLRISKEYESINSSSGSGSAPVSSTAGLSLKQQARLKQEQEEKEARMAAQKAKKRKSGPSLKQQARQMQEEEEKKELMEKAKEKEVLKAKIESDKYVRENDPNWSASAAGDKSQGQNQTTFRDKFGEDKGG